MRTFLFNDDNPHGLIHDVNDKEKEELLSNGWQDSPVGLKKAVVKKAKPSVETDLSPEKLVQAVKELGYHVFTDAELSQKIAATSNTGEPTLNELEDKYLDKPESLTKPELIKFGKESFGLKLTMSMKEATLIEKIDKAILEGESE